METESKYFLTFGMERNDPVKQLQQGNLSIIHPGANLKGPYQKVKAVDYEKSLYVKAKG
ncbi:MAG: hypothetical protein AAFV85_08695 [Cyanobacteria bacterium J06634_6]